MRSALPVVVALLVSFGPAVPAAWQARAGAAYTQENSPANLKALLEHTFRQFHVGNNVGIGKDHTIYSKIDGVVCFEPISRSRRRISVYPESVYPVGGGELKTAPAAEAVSAPAAD